MSDNLAKYCPTWKYTQNKCFRKFLHAKEKKKKNAPTDIHLCIPNIYGEQTVNVNRVRQWVTAVCMISHVLVGPAHPWNVRWKCITNGGDNMNKIFYSFIELWYCNNMEPEKTANVRVQQILEDNKIILNSLKCKRKI